MKKDIEWLKDKIRAERDGIVLSLGEGQETMREFIVNNSKHGVIIDVLRLIDQLDEPEVLTQEWIDEHSVAVSYDEIPDQVEVVYVDDLEKLINPKEEN